MNKIEEIQAELTKLDAGINCKLTVPRFPSGYWTLDVYDNIKWIVVEWQSPDRYGVSIMGDDVCYGEGPDEVYSNYTEALERIKKLLDRGKPRA